MNDTYKNTHGVLLGKNGYVMCLTCGKEVQGISTETPPGYAYCLHHKPVIQKENVMTAVPKPSQTKKPTKLAKTPKLSVVKVKKQKSEITKTKPRKGRIAQLIARVTEINGMNRTEILQLCEDEKLSKKTAANTLCVLRKLGLVHMPPSVA